MVSMFNISSAFKHSAAGSSAPFCGAQHTPSGYFYIQFFRTSVTEANSAVLSDVVISDGSLIVFKQKIDQIVPIILKTQRQYPTHDLQILRSITKAMQPGRFFPLRSQFCSSVNLYLRSTHLFHRQVHLPALLRIRNVCLLMIFLFLQCCARPLLAQEETRVRELANDIFDGEAGEQDLSELTEKLEHFRKHKIDLNHTKPEQLNELKILSPLIISNLYNHLERSGELLDLSELQSVPGFDLELIEKIMPFVTLSPSSPYKQLSFKNALKQGSHTLLWRYGQLLEKQKGYRALPGSRYLGGPQKIMMKYRYALGQTTAFSLLLKKDAGESFFSGASKEGFDFMSASLAFYSPGKISTLVIGDYSLQFGQGLTLWTGLSFGKGADVAGLAKNDTGLKPYTSSSEYSFFRGSAVKIKILKVMHLTSFISLRNLDASLSPTTDGNFTLSGINSSGLHRTASETAHKHNLRQYFYGSVLQFSRNSLSLGLIAHHSVYAHRFITGSQPYKKYGFTGRELTNLGLHYNYTFRNTYLFGETAKSIPGGMATVAGAMASISSQLSAVLLYRNYARNHLNFYGQAPGENADAINEAGCYAGININPSRKWHISLYADVFSFPWLKYRVDASSHGADFMAQLNYTPRKTSKIQLRLKSRTYEQNSLKALGPVILQQVRKNTCRLDGSFKMNRRISLQSRLEINTYRKGKTSPESGFLIYQDIDYKTIVTGLSANMRLAYFHSDSYDSRMYAYEDDVRYASGSGLYNGKGIRSYLNLKYRLSRHIECWGRYAVYKYPGAPTNGSGLDEITGSRKSEIKLQIGYQF